MPSQVDTQAFTGDITLAKTYRFSVNYADTSTTANYYECNSNQNND